MIGGGGNNFNEMLGTSLRNILDSENFNSDDKGQVEGKDSKTRLVCTFAAKEIFDNHVKLHRLVNGNYLDRPSPYKAHIRMAKEEGADNKDRLDEKYKETGKLLLPTFLLKK